MSDCSESINKKGTLHFFWNLTEIRSVKFFSLIIWYFRFGVKKIFFSMCPIFVRSILANLSRVHYFLFIGSMRWNKRTVIFRDEVKRLAKECKMRFSVSFSSCQRNSIKTFQIEAIIALITKMAMIFFMSLVKWPTIAVKKKAKIFRNFRNKSRSILMLHKIDKNKKVAPKLIFFNENFF